jgi:hypothetical protein
LSFVFSFLYLSFLFLSIIAIVAFVIDLLLLGPLDIPGTPAQTTYFYTAAYGMLALFSLKLEIKASDTKINPPR